MLSIINDFSNHPDPTLQRILYQNMGEFAVFFGRKMTIDNLIPLQTSCFNKKDFRLDVSCFDHIILIDRMPERHPLPSFESRIADTVEVSVNRIHSFAEGSSGQRGI